MSHVYVIRNAQGHYWQTGRGFQSRNGEGDYQAHAAITDATKYDSQDEAEKVAAFCCDGVTYVERVPS